MKKSLIAVLVAVVLVGVVGVTGVVFAQASNPGTWTFGQGNGNRAQFQIEDGSGFNHEEILASFSEALNISVGDLEARIEAGETLMQIAIAEGMTFEEARALMPMGSYGMQSMRGQDGRGYRESTQGQNYNGTCLQDGEFVPQFSGPNTGQGMSRGSRGGGRQ